MQANSSTPRFGRWVRPNYRRCGARVSALHSCSSRRYYLRPPKKRSGLGPFYSFLHGARGLLRNLSGKECGYTLSFGDSSRNTYLSLRHFIRTRRRCPLSPRRGRRRKNETTLGSGVGSKPPRHSRPYRSVVSRKHRCKVMFRSMCDCSTAYSRAVSALAYITSISATSANALTNGLSDLASLVSIRVLRSIGYSRLGNRNLALT